MPTAVVTSPTSRPAPGRTSPLPTPAGGLCPLVGGAGKALLPVLTDERRVPGTEPLRGERDAGHVQHWGADKGAGAGSGPEAVTPPPARGLGAPPTQLGVGGLMQRQENDALSVAKGLSPISKGGIFRSEFWDL